MGASTATHIGLHTYGYYRAAGAEVHQGSQNEAAMLVSLRAPHGSGGGGATLYGLPRRQCGLWVFGHFLTSQAKRKIRMLHMGMMLSKNLWQKRECLDL